MDIDLQIQRLVESHHTILAQITNLHNIHDTEAKRHDLAESIQLRLKDYECGVQAVELELEDELDGSSDNNYEVALDKLKENLRLAKTRFRKAQMQSKKNAEVSLKQQREMLFAGARDDNKKDANKGVEERVVGKAEDITMTLRRVHQMASTEVVKSNLNIEELEQSTRTLSELDERYSTVNLLLAGSNKLVRHLEQADKRDRQKMIAALSFLAACFAWVVWRRVLKGPVMLILWGVARLFGLGQLFARLFASSLPDSVVSITDLPEYYATVTDSASISDTIQTAVETATQAIHNTAIETTQAIHDDL